MRSKLLLAVFLVAVAGPLAGCGRDTVNNPAEDTPSAMDEAQVAEILSLEPELVEDGEFESEETTTIGGGDGRLAAISPIRFWRTIRDVDRYFTFAFADTDSTGRPTTAIVTVHKHLFGRFNILVGVPGSDDVAMDSTTRIVRKPLADHWVRRILLKRIPTVDSKRNPWRIVATSGVKVTSRGAETQIVSLRVQAAELDTTLTDPLQFMRLRRFLRLEPGSAVTFTATTLTNDDVVVMCLRGHRFRFHNNGDNTYTAVWKVPDLRLTNSAGPGPRPPHARIFHFGVNALSHGTLFDDEAPYDSQAWLLPFLLRPDLLAEALP
jgi:hypothetical protein